jgi:hypothetical protein
VILEAVVTTISESGQLNIAPMGPHFNPGNDHFELQPFESSITCHNLIDNPCGVLHVTDDVLLIVRSALNCLEPLPNTTPATKINGFVLNDSCRWHEFEAIAKPTPSARKIFHCRIVKSVGNRDFYGFNRAKHAVLEATIAATRIDFLPISEIQDQLRRLESIVDKTGGDQEQLAFQLVKEFVRVNTDA